MRTHWVLLSLLALTQPSSASSVACSFPTIWDMEDAQVSDVLEVIKDYSDVARLVVEPGVDLHRRVTIVFESGAQFSSPWSGRHGRYWPVCEELGLVCHEADDVLRVWPSSGPAALLRLSHDGAVSWRDTDTGAWTSGHGSTVLPPGGRIDLRDDATAELSTAQGNRVLLGPMTIKLEQEAVLQPGAASSAAVRISASELTLSGPAGEPSLSWGPSDQRRRSGLDLLDDIRLPAIDHDPPEEHCHTAWSPTNLRGRSLRLSGSLSHFHEWEALKEDLTDLGLPLSVLRPYQPQDADQHEPASPDHGTGWGFFTVELTLPTR